MLPSRLFFRYGPLLLLIGSLLVQEANAQEDLTLELAAHSTFTAASGWIHQPMISTDGVNWSAHGAWIYGDDEVHEVISPLTGKEVYLRVDRNRVYNINPQLESLRAAQQLPALAAVVIQDGKVTAAGATGNRRFSTIGSVTIDDHWHHGSLTKSMTATLAAMLVEEGLIDWSTTLGQVFPERVPSMAPGWSEVTLKHLLANSGGAPTDLGINGIWTKLLNFQGTPANGRSLLLDEIIITPQRYAPGSGYEYSNAGFSLAGMMLERVTLTPWEELMAKRFFPAFGMTSGGTGVPATPRHLDHPIGHSGNAATPQVWDPGPSADSPPAIGPAGTVHASILDLSRYVSAQLKGARGEDDSVLSSNSWATLHEPAFGNTYALGWAVLEPAWAGGEALHHTGSNTQWFTNVWIVPDMNWACIVCTNFGGNDAGTKVGQVVDWIVDLYGP